MDAHSPSLYGIRKAYLKETKYFQCLEILLTFFNLIVFTNTVQETPYIGKKEYISSRMIWLS